jgi:3-isopropylmalate/(R)-2-methylmalate dehydratase large subunit
MHNHISPRTLYRKLVDSHSVAQLDEQHLLLYADLHIMNEYTSPQAFSSLREKSGSVLHPPVESTANSGHSSGR